MQPAPKGQIAHLTITTRQVPSVGCANVVFAHAEEADKVDKIHLARTIQMIMIFVCHITHKRTILVDIG